MQRIRKQLWASVGFTRQHALDPDVENVMGSLATFTDESEQALTRSNKTTKDSAEPMHPDNGDDLQLTSSDRTR